MLFLQVIVGESDNDRDTRGLIGGIIGGVIGGIGGILNPGDTGKGNNNVCTGYYYTTTGCATGTLRYYYFFFLFPFDPMRRKITITMIIKFSCWSSNLFCKWSFRKSSSS